MLWRMFGLWTLKNNKSLPTIYANLLHLTNSSTLSEAIIQFTLTIHMTLPQGNPNKRKNLKMVFDQHLRRQSVAYLRCCKRAKWKIYHPLWHLNLNDSFTTNILIINDRSYLYYPRIRFISLQANLLKYPLNLLLRRLHSIFLSDTNFLSLLLVAGHNYFHEGLILYLLVCFL